MNCMLKVGQNEDCAQLMMVLCASHSVSLSTLDIWVALQGYYYFSSTDERVEMDSLGEAIHERLKVTAAEWNEAKLVLFKLGFTNMQGVPFRGGKVMGELRRKADARKEPDNVHKLLRRQDKTASVSRSLVTA